MIRFYQHLAQILQREPCVLATVIQAKGSVPREVGAKMSVGAAGCIFGTIGGGAGEARVIQQALIVLETGLKQRIEIDLSGAPGRVTQGICGGRMQVWLERWSGETAIALVHSMLTPLQKGQSITLITPFDAAQSPYLLAAPILSEPVDAFVEVLEPPPMLLIVGAGHVGESLAKVAHPIGFEIVVYDDRSEWANPQRYPQAAKILTDDIRVAIGSLASQTQLYVALVTRSYQQDLAALDALLNREHSCPYIGMIGSEKRVCQVYGAIASAAHSKLTHLYAPIGLDIGALTPAEIAVSVGAELILVRRGGTGRPLSETLRRLAAPISREP